uniref:Uncharacterized protein n=1 Tax=Cacopsylla melanoneura TaxID=428564 RepID=A0A8D8V724_9HEMI
MCPIIIISSVECIPQTPFIVYFSQYLLICLKILKNLHDNIFGIRFQLFFNFVPPPPPNINFVPIMALIQVTYIVHIVYTDINIKIVSLFNFFFFLFSSLFRFS